MLCKKCGFTNKPEAKFCRKCGNALVMDSSIITKLEVENDEEKLNTGDVFIIIGVVLLILLGISAIILGIILGGLWGGIVGVWVGSILFETVFCIFNYSKTILLILISLNLFFLIVFAFYWVAMRPYLVRENCNSKALDQSHFSPTTDTNPQNIYKIKYDSIYQSCLRDSGL